ncbi:hypothetical protein [uncultured Paracoccus sp.]|uniref:DNA polymerase Y family protein n=1 Tax=uncultured Paracoccus sp. TaxID=189685 RepID=UPI0026266912|nr:hypothetical protein [uncultured Paracoccus sp.]
MGPFRTLYLDMNSFFASVEQQLDPSLRGRPVAITAMEKPVGICVAASYEAKAFGVRTGTPVQEARRLCPGLAFRPSRHRLYVCFNLKIADVLDRHAELERIRSVDEFQLGLSGDATSLEGATRLVSVLKVAVAREVGPCLRFSAGIGPNHLLAKIAGKLEKPNGFQWLSPENMPDRLAHLALDDLPGISRAMKARLELAGIRDVPSLCRLDPRHARAIWRSVEGERFVRALQGEPIPLMRTKRGGFGNSKVLAPEFRDPRAAYLVSRWLVEKAVARLRRDGRVAAVFSLYIARMGAHSLRQDMTCAASQDGLRVTCANFLTMRPDPVHDLVLMNPPFSGTHWMRHVRHAFDFLKPGGTLRAILPASAEVNETQAHEKFRAWAECHGPGWRGLWRDLPPESFAEVGTNIATVILTLHKPAA